MEAHGHAASARSLGGAGELWREGRRRYPNLQAVVMVWLIFVLVFVVGAVLGWVSGFGQVETALLLGSFALVVAFGQNVVILTGGIDLSIPFALTATAILLTELASSISGLWVIPLALTAAAAIGIWNGLGVAYLKISPLIMTLATNVILLGLILALTEGTPQGLAPDALVDFMTSSVGPVRTVIVVGIVFTILASVLLLNTTFGRYIYAVGSSAEVSYLSGLPVKRVLVGVYALAGLSYGIAAVMLCGWNQQASFQMGDPYLFPSIAAVVLGGTSILGGRGNFVGTAGGAVLFTAIGTVLAGTNVPESTRNIVIGLVLLGAVALIQRERIGD